MPNTDSPNLVAPRLRRRVRRYELAAGLGAGLLVVAAALVHTLSATSASDDEVLRGRRFRPLVADFRGAVEYRAFGTPDWRALRWSDGFEQGDQLRTGPGASCDVLLTWATGVHVAPETVLTWSKLASRGSVKEVELTLRKGRVLASLDKLPAGSLFEVVTRHSRTRVKGTTLSVSADDDKTHVTVLEGVVEVVDATDPTRRVEVTSGRAVDFARSGGGKVMPLSATERAKLLGEISGVDRRIERVSPVGSKAGEPDSAEAVEVTRVEDSSAGSRPEGQETDELAIEDLLRGAVELLAGGHTDELLELCTPGFRALLWSPRARALGIADEYLLSQGSGRAAELRGAIDAAMTFRVSVVTLEVSVDGDVAYASGVLQVEATSRTEAGRGAVAPYACTARLLRGSDQVWRLDLATASEDLEGSQ